MKWSFNFKAFIHILTINHRCKNKYQSSKMAFPSYDGKPWLLRPDVQVDKYSYAIVGFSASFHPLSNIDPAYCGCSEAQYQETIRSATLVLGYGLSPRLPIAQRWTETIGISSLEILNREMCEMAARLFQTSLASQRYHS